MQDIRSREDALFLEWKQTLGYDLFIPDGVVDPDTWERQSRKILLILKEVNSTDGKQWDLRKFLHAGGRPRTWNVVVQWLAGLHRLEDDLSWAEVTQEARNDPDRTVLRTIAVMNLKKAPGTATSNMREIGDSAKKDREFLRRQFALYDPDIVITCGTHHPTWDVLHDMFVGGDWLWTKRGFRYARFTDSKTRLFAATHPEARVPEPAKYYYLLDAVREVVNG